MSDLRSLVRTPFLSPSPLAPYRGVVTENVQRHCQYALISEGDDGIDTNFAVVFGPIGDDEFFARASRMFGSQPYAIVIETDSDSTLEGRLIDDGWLLDEQEIAMVLQSIPAIPDPPAELEIQAVNNEQTYDAFMQVVPGNRAWVPVLAAATDPDVGLFVGMLDGQPVATSRLSCYGELGEVTAIQTLETHRRRGYGRALAWAAIAEAGQRGCHQVVLTATEMGFPLYLQMGFVEVCTYRTYIPPTTEPM